MSGHDPGPERGRTAGKATEPSVLLYRCPTPTDYLCPCGAVARRLRRLGVQHRVERVPYGRRDRPEIVELTGQRRVPVLVDRDEVVHDSKRIIQYLEHAYGGPVGGESGDRPGHQSDD